jgi:uncharacterized oxidoreductase
MKTSQNTILITGGATGFGLALAEILLRNDNEVIICGRRQDKLDEAKSKLPSVHIKQCDVSIESNRKELIEWTISGFPGFNILANNAGIQQMLFFKQTIGNDVITDEITINLITPIHFTNLVAPHFMKQQEAAIINITSGLGFVPIAVMPVYCSTKAALHSFSVSSRHQFKDTSIKVFEIIPPIVDTELDKGARAKRGMTYRGIPSSDVAVEFMKAFAGDQLEFPIGQSADLFDTARSEKTKFIFDRMNQH